MTPRGRRVLGGLLAASVLLALVQGPAPAGNGTDLLSTLKPGHWIQAEGLIQSDSTSTCDELRILTGDFLDDDWALRGYLVAVDTLKREAVIGGIRFQATDNTAFDSPKPSFRRFADLRKGMLMEIEGTYLKHRRFLALEVDDESDERGNPPWPQNRIRVVARVERLDFQRRIVTSMGFVFQLTDKTRIRSVIE